MPAPRTTVVTGASGWLGRALVERLAADPQRQRLRLLAATGADAAALRERYGARDGVEIVVGDIARSDTVLRLLHAAGDDTDVVHTAGVIHPRRVHDFTSINVNGTRHLVLAAADAGVRRLVHVSSNSPFGTNPDPADTFRGTEPYRPYLGYGRSKMEAEVAVFDAVEHGLDAVIVRPPWFYGPYQPPRQTTFFKLVAAGRFPVIGDGSQRRSMVYVENLVDGVLAAELTASATGRGYWIADERPYLVSEIVTTVGQALAEEGIDVAPPSTRIPPVVARAAETADRVLQGVGIYQQQVHVLGEMGHSIACDIADARAELGYQPRFALHEGMRASIRWCIEQGLLG